MTKYATFGPDGILNGRYDDEENKIIPADAVPISDEQCNLSIHEKDGYLQLADGVVTWVVPPPPSPDPAKLKAAAHQRINAAYEQAVNALTEGYPDTEIASWPKQEAEARKFLDDESADTPWLRGAAVARGINIPNLAALIVRNADALAPLHGGLTGKRQKLRDQIDALGETPEQEQLDAIQW